MISQERSYPVVWRKMTLVDSHPRVFPVPREQDPDKNSCLSSKAGRVENFWKTKHTIEIQNDITPQYFGVPTWTAGKHTGPSSCPVWFSHPRPGWTLPKPDLLMSDRPLTEEEDNWDQVMLPAEILTNCLSQTSCIGQAKESLAAGDECHMKWRGNFLKCVQRAIEMISVWAWRLGTNRGVQIWMQERWSSTLQRQIYVLWQSALINIVKVTWLPVAATRWWKNWTCAHNFCGMEVAM